MSRGSMNQFRNIFFVLLIPTLNICADPLADTLKQAQQTLSGGAQKPQDLFLTAEQEMQKMLEELKKEKDLWQVESKGVDEALSKDVEQLKAQISSLESELQENSSEFVTQKLALIREHLDVLNGLRTSREDYWLLLNDFIKSIQDFLEDSDFSKYKRRLDIDSKPFYTLKDLQKVHQLINDQEKVAEQFKDSVRNAQREQDHLKQIALDIGEQLKNVKKQLDASGTPGAEHQEQEGGVTVGQRQELLQLKMKYLTAKQRLNDMELKLQKYKISAVKYQDFVEKSRLDTLKTVLRIVKSAVRVTEIEVQAAKESLAKKRQEIAKNKQQYRQKINDIKAKTTLHKTDLENLAKQYNLDLGPELDTWTLEPRQTVSSYLGLAEVGNLNSALGLLRKQQEYFESLVSFEDAKLDYEELLTNVKESYYNILSRQFDSEEEIINENKKYAKKRSEIETRIGSLRNKIATLDVEISNLQKRTLENLENRVQDLQNQRNRLFRGQIREYNETLRLFFGAQNHIKEQINFLNKIKNINSDSIETLENGLEQIKFIMGEFEAITIWYRPAYAITWEGVQRIPADIEKFGVDLYSYMKKFDLTFWLNKAWDIVTSPFALVWFIIRFLILLGFLVLVRMYLPSVMALFIRLSQTATHGRLLSLLIAMLIGFTISSYVLIAFWLALLGLISWYTLPDLYLYILFYLLSIPYLLYIYNRFARFFVKFNHRHDHAFLDKDFQRRCVFVFSTLIYATITIVLFRRAFLLPGYHTSELPTILQAVNFIIFQIAVIFLISKEQILSLLSAKSPTWVWIRERVDNYYYLILLFVIAIIVMSNPWVGYGRLVLYILANLIYTALLIRILLWLHAFFKNVASAAFFYTDDEVVKDRFAYAKTWFGLFIIGSFVILVFFGIIIAAKIWGWQFGFSDVWYLTNEPLFNKTSINPITTLSIIQILLFILGGFVASFALNRFVLDRIFDLLLVDAGVQNTVTSITRYVLIIIAIFLGFQSAGLDSLVIYLIGGLILSIGWVIKEPISDFIAYFILLVQRPIKIGDYIKIDDEARGVVRKITPRSVVLRRKNSTTIIIPNSSVINKTVVNWNYTRNFIAINDMEITVSYQSDPEQVREVLVKVADEHDKVLKNPSPIIRLDNFGEYGFVFMLRPFVSSNFTLDQWDIASELRFRIMKEFRARGINIAIPVRLMVQGPQMYQPVEDIGPRVSGKD